MYFTGAFWLILLVAFCLLQLGGGTPRRRAVVYALAGLAGLAFAVDLAPLPALVLVASLASVVTGVRVAARRPAFGVALGGIAVPLFAWVTGKLAVALGDAAWLPILFVGMSYFLVKAWSLFKDVLDGKEKDPDAIGVIAYLIHLPTILVGPMHQYSEYRDQLSRPYRLDAERAIDCLFRIVLGLFKIFVVAALLAPASLPGLVHQPDISLHRLIEAAFLYSIVVYCDFSGFCDIAIATSRLIGMDVPENFDWPYAAGSIRDFWRRWHITFSRALTAHIFLPVSRRLSRRWPRAQARVVAASYAVTFGLCGYWHGATVNFVLWGLYHAAGLIAFDWWTRRRRAAGKLAIGPRPLAVRAIGAALTFSFVSIGWILFALPIATLLRVRGL